MEQYKYIFGAYRVPGEKVDSCQVFSTENPQPPNLIVAYKNQVYTGYKDLAEIPYDNAYCSI